VHALRGIRIRPGRLPQQAAGSAAGVAARSLTIVRPFAARTVKMIVDSANRKTYVLINGGNGE